MSFGIFMRWSALRLSCDEVGRDGYQGVIFKPIVGSAIFWQNFYPNGTGHKGVYHAGLPVKSGMKVGLTYGRGIPLGSNQKRWCRFKHGTWWARMASNECYDENECLPVLLLRAASPAS